MGVMKENLSQVGLEKWQKKKRYIKVDMGIRGTFDHCSAKTNFLIFINKMKVFPPSMANKFIRMKFDRFQYKSNP